MLIVGFLLITGISLESYNVGGDYISVMLSPATVVLAVPLYRQISKLTQFWKPILAGIFAGSLTSIACVIAVSKLIGLSETLMLSLMPKSVTIPMGSVISAQIGGIKHKVAQGIAIGTASHALGTTRAMEMGEVQGAMSSLAIGIAGLFTAIVAPVILSILP